MRVTIKDVARDAGVAISTVSKVLNGADNLRPGTRYAVEAAMRELNYIPNPNARSLKSPERMPSACSCPAFRVSSIPA